MKVPRLTQKQESFLKSIIVLEDKEIAALERGIKTRTSKYFHSEIPKKFGLTGGREELIRIAHTTGLLYIDHNHRKKFIKLSVVERIIDGKEQSLPLDGSGAQGSALVSTETKV